MFFVKIFWQTFLFGALIAFYRAFCFSNKQIATQHQDVSWTLLPILMWRSPLAKHNIYHNNCIYCVRALLWERIIQSECWVGLFIFSHKTQPFSLKFPLFHHVACLKTLTHQVYNCTHCAALRLQRSSDRG